MWSVWSAPEDLSCTGSFFHKAPEWSIPNAPNFAVSPVAKKTCHYYEVFDACYRQPGLKLIHKCERWHIQVQADHEDHRVRALKVHTVSGELLILCCWVYSKSQQIRLKLLRRVGLEGRSQVLE